MHRMWRRGPDGEIIRAEPEREARSGPVAAPGSATPAGGDAPVVTPPARAKLVLALRLGLRDTYDYLGAVLLMSISWAAALGVAAAGGHAVARALSTSLPGLLPTMLSVAGAFAGTVLVGGPLAAGICRYCRNAAARQEPEVFDLAWGYRRAAGRSLALAALQAGVGVVLLADTLFFLFQKAPAFVVLGALFGYAWLFWGLMAMYAWPLLAEQELGTLRLLKKAALLVLDNFGYSLLLGALLLVLTLALWISAVGGVLLWAGAAAMIATQATRELLRRYAVLPPDPTLDPIADEATE